MVNIVVQGICGRMGRNILEVAAGRTDCKVVAGIDAATCGDTLPCPVFGSPAQLAAVGIAPDVLIDFSHPTATAATLKYCGSHQLPIVVCTTGLSEETLALMKEVSTSTAVFFSANMSLGVNVLAKLAQKAQEALKGFDIEIVERHHRNKLDAPSGTALMLADAINQQAEGLYHYVYDRQPVRQVRGQDELGISAVRGGSIVGDHEIIFAGEDEVVTLSHSAQSRRVFAAGAVAAALFLAGKEPGLYSMDEMLEDLC